MKIDVFAHILPLKYKEELQKRAGADFYGAEWFELIPTLYELDRRFQIMDAFGDYAQVLTLSSPPIEAVVGPKDAVELARLANEEMAELVYKYPHRFIAAVGCLPMSDIEASLEEVDYVINELHFRGVQVFTNILGKPLDSPEFMPLYEKMSSYGLPIWIHPHRVAFTPDYVRALAVGHAGLAVRYVHRHDAPGGERRHGEVS
jgi:predicted TIM-barrel fold metal-dependent hydrolase